MKKSIKVIATGILLSLTIFAACNAAPETSTVPVVEPAVTEGVTLPETDGSDSTLPETVVLEVTATPTPEPTAISTPTPTPTEIPHVHNYIAAVMVEATCEATGVTAYTCECGDAYTEEIPATGHDYIAEEDSKAEATCTKDGKTADQVCSFCGNVIAGETIEKKGHSYGEYVYNNDATMEKDGTQSRTCSACGKVDTKTAKGTKLPFDPYTLRAVTSLDDIPVVGIMTDEDDSIFNETRKNFEAGKIEKIRYIASNGEQFCMWNVRVQDDRNVWGKTTYYWFMAPVEGKFSDGYQHCNMVGSNVADLDKNMILRAKISGSVNESMLERDESIPLAYRKINTKECPVTLYEIEETDTMSSVWVESTNCGQEGVGTCGSFDCKQTCLRYTTLQTLNDLPRQKGWSNWMSGECGRISWNGKLLVLYYNMKSE